MSKDTLKKELERMEDYNARARRVNAIKKKGSDSQFGKLLTLELDELKEKLVDGLIHCVEENQTVSALTHRLQGLEIARQCIFNEWELEEEEEGEND